jgi:hypothetical protein
MSGHTIDGSLKGVVYLAGIIHQSQYELKGGLFFLLNDNIATTSVAKAIVTINASNTVIQHHPPSVGSVPTTLEKTYSFAL